MAVEEDQCHLASLVVNMDAVGNAPVAFWRHLVAVNPDLERDDDAFGRSGDAGLAAAVDHRMGQMENQIAQDRGGRLFAAAQQPRHRLFDLGANAFQARNRRKQRIEKIWAHGLLCVGSIGGLQL